MTGKLPNGWKVEKLEDVVDILDSKRVPINSKERETRQGPIPYYGATGQVGWIDDFLFDEELILLGEDGAPFFDSAKQKAYVIRGKSWVNNHAHVLRAKNGIPNAYIKHYLDIVDYHGFVTGTTRHKLNQAAMRQIPIPVAPPEQQKRIVAEIEKQFSRLDEAVANLKRVKANLKRYKATVLKAAVEGRLVETEAELARKRTPSPLAGEGGGEGASYETGTQLLQRILETRRSQWQGKGKYKEPAAPDTTDLPELPEGWVWASLDQLSWDSGYGTSAKCSYENPGPAVLRIPNVDKAAIDLADIKYAPSDFLLGEGEVLSPGDMLVIRTNGSKSLIGRAAIVTTRFQRPTTYASYLIRFRLLDVEMLSAWVLAYWQSHSSRLWIESKAATSAGQHNISMSVLATAPVPLPPVAEQHRIVDEVDRRLSILDETEAQVDTNLQCAERLRQSTLSAAFSSNFSKHDQFPVALR